MEISKNDYILLAIQEKIKRDRENSQRGVPNFGTKEGSDQMSSQEMRLFADELAEVLSRRALTPQFGLGGVPMEVAEKVLGMSRKTIMDLMERGELDIGIITTAQKKRGTRVYRNSYISPKKFYELTGYIWEGEKKEQKLFERKWFETVLNLQYREFL